MATNFENATNARHKWWILVAMTGSIIMIFVEQTAVPIALPRMQNDLHTSSLTILWIINAYLLPLAALVIFGGKIGDLYGHRKIFLGGLALFTVASLVTGLAPTSAGVIIGRGLQGIGAAFMTPHVPVIINHYFNSQERGKAMGISIGLATAFAASGPLLGGLLTEFINWRAIFLLNIPFGCTIFFIIVKIVPSLLHDLDVKERIDWLGLLFLVIFIFFLVVSVMESPTYGWNSYFIISGIGLGLVALILFVYIELKKNQPLVDLTLFKNKSITISLIILLISQISCMTTLFWPIFFQNILHVTPVIAGIMMIPHMIPFMFMPAVGGHLMDRYGARKPLLLGTLGTGLGLFWIAIFAGYQSYMGLLPGFLLFGFSVPLLFSPTVIVALNAVEINKRGMISGISGIAKQFGAVIGFALLGAVITSLVQYQTANNVIAKNTVNIADKAYIFAFSIGMLVVVAFNIIAFVLAIYFPQPQK